MSGTPKTQPPVRVRHTYTQTLEAPPVKVFPLLCPVREAEWVPGWRCDWVLSESGVAEPGCVFQTPGEEGLPAAIWLITEHDPLNLHVEMVKTTPAHSLTRLVIDLEPLYPDRTRADIAYEFTALSARGEVFVRSRTAEWYEGFMRGWESAMNHYLAHGQKIS
jgi:hypothetical protein